jgi:hypothetical protein
MRITERKPFLGLGCTVAPKNLGCRRAAVSTTTLHLTGCASARVRPRLRHSGKRGIRHRARARPADQLPAWNRDHPERVMMSRGDGRTVRAQDPVRSLVEKHAKRADDA